MCRDDDFAFCLTQAFCLYKNVLVEYQKGSEIGFVVSELNDFPYIKINLTHKFNSHVQQCRKLENCPAYYFGPVCVNYRVVSQKEFLQLYEKKYRTNEVLNEMSYENHSLQEIGWTVQQRVSVLRIFQRKKGFIILCCPKVEDVQSFKINLIGEISEVTNILDKVEDGGVLLEKRAFKKVMRISKRKLVVAACLYDCADSFLHGADSMGISRKCIMKNVSAVLSIQEMIDEGGVYNFCELATPDADKKEFEYLSNAGFILSASIDAMKNGKRIHSWKKNKANIKVN